MNRKLALFLCLLVSPLQLNADAIVRSSAMFADTIAEYHVEQGRVRLDLEIGGGDIGAFRNLLPDAIYSELGFGEQPLEERLRLFVTRDMAVFHDGEPLPGVLREIGPAVRPLRDEITGEELPTPEDQSEYVIAATLEYLLPERPAELTLTAPGATGTANIGFVLYHRGIPVNDFRYLSSGFTAQLDWDDPWYSRFPQRALRRQYEAPMAGFIYVEPFEVRKEIIVRPHDLQQWVDLGLEGQDVIPADQQEEVKRRVVAFLEEYFPVRIDGEPAEGALDRINFLRRTLKSSNVIDGQDIDLLPATLGVIYVFPTDGLPQAVEMDWNLFTPKMQRVMVASVDQAGPLPTMLEPDYPVLRWENFLKNPVLPTLTEIRRPPTSLQRAAGWAQWGFGLLAAGVLLWLVRSGRAGIRPLPVTVLVVSAALGAGCAYTWHSVQLNEERLQQLVGDLLHNVYRAFDFRGEDAVYDVLERSVAGDLLADVYLETRQGLELASQGGAQVKVKNIEMLSTELTGDDGNAIGVEARWNVMGSVGHWGHIHQRTNGYHAQLRVSEVDGAWKLTGLEILAEERL
jgi:hypothetical protein